MSVPPLYRHVPSSTPLPRRRYHGRSSTGTSTSTRSLGILTATTVGILSTYLLPYPTVAQAESPVTKPDRDQSPRDSLGQTPIRSLLRSYLVYTLCSFPSVIDHSPRLLSALFNSSFPGIKPLTETVVRETFFRQFVPGETAEECLDVMAEMRTRGIGGVLNYSAEASDDSANRSSSLTKGASNIEEERYNELLSSLDQAGAHEDEMARQGYGKGSTALAIKVTGLIDPAILQRASTTLLRLRPLTTSNSPSSPLAAFTIPFPGSPTPFDVKVLARADTSVNPLMTLQGAVPALAVLETDEGIRREDVEKLRDLWEKLRRIALKASEKRISIMIDAEHTQYQPALDGYTLLLSTEYNRPPSPQRSIWPSSASSSEQWSGPLIFGTYQSYLVRQPHFLKEALGHAQANGYALGIKLVRGAYHEGEKERWSQEGRSGPGPIWPDKEATDRCYDSSISTILSTLASQLSSPRPELAPSVVFGTHNPDSVQRVMDELVKAGLARRSLTSEGSRRIDNRLCLREEVRGKVHIAQLYGMGDALTDRVAASFHSSCCDPPVALKYMAYGKLSGVMPFLGRRAIENKSLLNGERGAAAERKRVGREIWRRFW